MLLAPLLTLTFISALPPITSPAQALGQLGAAAPEGQVEALKNLDQACRGKFRRDLKDRPELLARVGELAKVGGVPVKKAALDTARCFAAKSFLEIVEPALDDADPSVVAYAAEVSARLEEPMFVEPLLARLATRRERCLAAGVDAAALEVCVWLTYAPGALLGGASAELKKKAGDAAVAMLASPYPKVREVAVETIHSTGQKAYAPELAKLIARETKKGELAQPNSPELVGRFRQRQKALEAAK